MQFGLRRAAAFVSSPIHSLRINLLLNLSVKESKAQCTAKTELNSTQLDCSVQFTTVHWALEMSQFLAKLYGQLLTNGVHRSVGYFSLDIPPGTYFPGQ